MYLVNLVVESLELSTVIRNIPFRSGLNLIVDSGKDQKSGNDIGKTTFLRAIDFCFGSATDELFVDRDEKKRNEEIKDFLVGQKISFTLNVGYTLNRTDLILKRWFTGKIQKNGMPEVKQSINNDEYGIRNYTKMLNKKIFGLNEKPTFRDLIPKFIREEKNSIGSLLRYLGTFASNEEYNSIHLVLFGFKDNDILEKKNLLTKRIQENENKKGVYISDYGQKNFLSSQISIKKNEVDNFIEDRNKLQQKIADVANLKTDIDDLNKLAKKLSIVNSEMVKFEIDIKNIEKNILRLETEKTNVDIELIEELYKEAGFYNQAMNKDFQDIVNFHNKMIVNKINFSKKSLSHKKSKLSEYTQERENLFESYQLLKKDNDNIIFEKLNNINNDLIKKSNELNIVQNVYNQIDKLEDSIKQDSEQLEKVLGNIEKGKEVIQNNINIFNKYFTEYTRKLYNDEYCIYLGDDISKPFEINTKFNPGDGKKKAVITAFDLAYSAFLLEAKIKYPKFIAEDQMELIDVKQLEELFKISNTIQSQLIIPVLKSKINQIDGLEDHEILVLSENNKFFKF